MAIHDFINFSGKFTLGLISKDQRTAPRFFKPFQSPLNILGKTTSIITDPLIPLGVAIYKLLETAFHLLSFTFNLLTLNLRTARANLSEAAASLYLAPIMLIIAIASPILNLIDLIGTVITSLLELNHSQKPNQGKLPAAQNV